MGKGAFINYVDQERGRVSQMSTMYAYVVNLSAKGVKNLQNPVNVVYGCPLNPPSY